MMCRVRIAFAHPHSRALFREDEASIGDDSEMILRQSLRRVTFFGITFRSRSAGVPHPRTELPELDNTQLPY